MHNIKNQNNLKLGFAQPMLKRLTKTTIGHIKYFGVGRIS
jgi:hypothetical protein